MLDLAVGIDHQMIFVVVDEPNRRPYPQFATLGLIQNATLQPRTEYVQLGAVRYERHNLTFGKHSAHAAQAHVAAGPILETGELVNVDFQCSGHRASAGSARADNAPGVTDTEIKIGQTMPYSGPASAYGVIGRTEAAYFKMINEQGGINGRKINLISLDDAYSPPKTVEQVRRLVEEEHVAFLFNTLGTPPNTAIRPYCNDNQDPAALRRHRRGQVGRSEAFSVDDGLPTELPDRGPHLRQAHPGDQAGRQDRGALSPTTTSARTI